MLSLRTGNLVRGTGGDQLKPRQPRHLPFSRLFTPLICKHQQTICIQQSQFGDFLVKTQMFRKSVATGPPLLGQSPLSCHIMTSVFWLFSLLPDVVSFFSLIPWSIAKAIYHILGKNCPKDFICCSLPVFPNVLSFLFTLITKPCVLPGCILGCQAILPRLLAATHWPEELKQNQRSSSRLGA